MERYTNKISFIVPCYNVARYVRKCITSIAEQTYSNIEIIPVDDGSLDSTGAILDELSGKDSRILVIHKENEGVSAARNSGLAAATGDYVVFVDGDDYLDRDYAEYMIGLSKIADSDFVMSKDCFTKDSDIKISKDIPTILTSVQATALLISPRVIVGCWNKMFKKNFLDENKITFSSNLFYGEGLNFIICAAQLANNVTVGEQLVYYYRRNNEVSATSKYNVQKYRNGETALNKISDELLVNDADVLLMMALHKSIFCLGAISQTYAHGAQKEYAADCHHWEKIIVDNLPLLLCSSKVSLYRKLLLVLGLSFPMIMAKLDMWRRRRVANHSVK